MNKVWEKQEKENSKAFNAFRIYRDMPPHERTLQRTCDKLGRKWGSYHTQLEKWSSENNWIKRCEEWDAYRDRHTERQRLNEAKEMRENLAKFARGLLSKGAQRMLQMKEEDIPAMALSKWMLDSLKVMQELSLLNIEDGNEKLILEETRRVYADGRDLVSDVIARFSEDEDDTEEFE